MTFVSSLNPERHIGDHMTNDNDPNRPRTADSPQGIIPASHFDLLAMEEPYCDACQSTPLTTIDKHASRHFISWTLKCETCGECFLLTWHGSEFTQISLPHFLERRGDEPGKRPLHDCSMSEHLIHAMVCDVWPSPATAVDFGLDTPDHYAAMQRAVKQGLTTYELDRVLGSGSAISRLVAFASPNRQGRCIKFLTAYDDMPMEPSEESQPRTSRKHKAKHTLHRERTLDI
jgi:hypothetical protein